MPNIWSKLFLMSTLFLCFKFHSSVHLSYTLINTILLNCLILMLNTWDSRKCEQVIEIYGTEKSCIINKPIIWDTIWAYWFILLFVSNDQCTLIFPSYLSLSDFWEWWWTVSDNNCSWARPPQWTEWTVQLLVVGEGSERQFKNLI